MRSDISKIKFDGENVIVPAEVWDEVVAFCRGHGEIHLKNSEALRIFQELSFGDKNGAEKIQS